MISAKKDSLIGGIAFILWMFSSIVWAQQVCDTSSPATTPTSDFEFFPNRDGTERGIVKHIPTGKIWTRCPIGYEMVDLSLLTGSPTFSCNRIVGDRPAAIVHTWENAANRAQRYSFEGFDGWRVPNIKELTSVMEQTCIQPHQNMRVFPELQNAVYSLRYWSSTPSKGSDTSALSYTTGAIGSVRSKAEANVVLLVRDTEISFAEDIAPAFQHPRCLNCHAVEATGFDNTGSEPFGLPAGHTEVNASTPDSVCQGCHIADYRPAGTIDPEWHAAPLANDLRNLSIAELCNKAKTVPGSATSAHQHLTEDRLLVWSFHPELPFGNVFAEAAPPYNVEAWRDLIDLWRDAGLPCE